MYEDGPIHTLASIAEVEYACWIEDESGDWDGEEFCRACVRKMPVVGEVRSSQGSDECDGCRHCASCGKLLHYVLTDYGVRAEMEHFIESGVPYPLTPEAAYHLQAIEDQLPYMKTSWIG